MPSGWGVEEALSLGFVFITPERYCAEGFGDVAEETEDES